MITEEHIKEAISLKYIELIAYYNGFNISNSNYDYGIDLSIEEVNYNAKRKRYIPSHRKINIQLKATTERSIIEDKNHIKYDLKSKNFNDLIETRDAPFPLILILFILPEKKEDWLQISNEKLITKKCAYWYLPDENEEMTENMSSKRIKIDKLNLITLDTFNQFIKNFSNE